MDELIYRTSTVAYDTCLADRPQTQDDIKQELADPAPRKYRFRPRDRHRPGIRLTPGPGVKDEEEPDFAGSAEDELGSDGSSHEDDERPDDLDEPMHNDEEEIPPPPPPPPTPVVSHRGIGSGGAVPVPPPPPPPVPIAAGVTTAGDPFEEEDVASRGRVPAPEKGQRGVPPGGQPSSKSMAQPARPSPVPARSGAEEGERRGRTKGFYTQKDPFTGEDATPRSVWRSRNSCVPTTGCHWFLGRP